MKPIIIEDSIYLPDLRHLGWGWETQGPVTHPFMADDALIKRLLTATVPVKFMYVVNPDKSRRVHVTLDNYSKTYEEFLEEMGEVKNQTIDAAIQPADSSVQFGETQGGEASQPNDTAPQVTETPNEPETQKEPTQSEPEKSGTEVSSESKSSGEVSATEQQAASNTEEVVTESASDEVKTETTETKVEQTSAKAALGNYYPNKNKK